LRGSVPKAEEAATEFAEATERIDQERAERAIVALARSRGIPQTIEQLWLCGCRHGGAGGHAAISVANCLRAVETIGWQHAEPVLRFIVQDLFHAGWLKPDASWQPNIARAERILRMRSTGEESEVDEVATRELFSRIRSGQPDEACELAMDQLQRGVSAQAIWDAVHLATAELMVRHNSGWGLASRPLHSNTSTNALHYGFRTSGVRQTKLLLLLQAVAWAAEKTRGDLAGNGLRDLSIMELSGSAVPASSEQAVAEIFELLPSRTYRWDPAADPKAVLTYGKRELADEACRKVFSLTSQHPAAVPLFMQTARSWLCRKASNDHHEYKFLAAILEDALLVSPAWQPHLFAASVHYFHGNQTPDSSIIQQAREALRKL
jgi:hypothetical protein